MTEQITPTIYEMVSEYSIKFSAPFKNNEREAVANYFNALVIRLVAGDDVDTDVMITLAEKFDVDTDRIPGIAQYLSQWGTDDE